jgi:hypothetical protein
MSSGSIRLGSPERQEVFRKCPKVRPGGRGQSLVNVSLSRHLADIANLLNDRFAPAMSGHSKIRFSPICLAEQSRHALETSGAVDTEARSVQRCIGWLSLDYFSRGWIAPLARSTSLPISSAGANSPRRSNRYGSGSLFSGLPKRFGPPKFSGTRR